MWFASGAYLGLRKKRYKAMTYQSFNIIVIIRLAFSHAISAYRRRAAAFDPPLAKGGRVQMLMTSPHTRTPYTPPCPL